MSFVAASSACSRQILNWGHGGNEQGAKAAAASRKVVRLVFLRHQLHHESSWRSARNTRPQIELQQQCVQVRSLVMKGVSLNTSDAAGYTALHHAVISGDLSTVLMCLPRESPIGEMTEVTAKAHDSLTALHIAAKDRDPRIAHAIVSYATWMVRSCSCFPICCIVALECILRFAPQPCRTVHSGTDCACEQVSSSD